MARKFKILKRKADCFLLCKVCEDGLKKYIVKDIEGDVIYMTLNNLNGAKKAFDSYDINKVREEKKREFEKWLDEFAEA